MTPAMAGHDRTLGSAPCFVMADAKRGVAFTANYSGGSLTVSGADGGGIVAPDGSGPGHMCSRPDGKRAYVITELGGDVVVMDTEGGRTAEIIRTAKADTVGGEGSADIHLSPYGRFLYASCRLKADGLAVFRVSAETGRMERTGYCPTGKHPRDFAITPDGRYILVACRDENAIGIYSVDKDTGMPVDPGKRIPAKAPVRVRWIK